MSELKLKWEGRWNEIKSKVEKAYAELTEDDLKYQDGKKDEFLGKLQQKLGKTREEVEKWLNSL